MQALQFRDPSCQGNQPLPAQAHPPRVQQGAPGDQGALAAASCRSASQQHVGRGGSADWCEAQVQAAGHPQAPSQQGAALQQQQAADDEERQLQEQPPEEAKSSWQAALLWSMGVENGQDLLNPAYQEAVAGPKLRTISAPAAGIDPNALAAQFLARQQQQQLLQQQHLGIPPANPIMPAPGLAQQVLQQQMLLAQLQQQQQSGL